MKEYKTLEKVFKKLSDIDRAKSVLEWDMAVNMPEGGAAARSDQLATLQAIGHAIGTDDGVGDLIGAAKDNEKKLNDWQKSNLKAICRYWNHNNAVPAKLLTDLTKAGAECGMVWRKARAENDFKTFAPYLDKVVKLVREVAKAKSDAFNCSPYDALIDQFDPGLKTEQLDKIFDNLKEFLPGFIQEVVEKQKSQPALIPIKGPFPIEKQKAISEKMLEVVGFDLKTGRLDESHHPFCGGYPSDIRITTRYNEDEFFSSLMGVLHECGHAMYEAGLPKNWDGQPVGEALGMSVHESQSLLIEMQVCRSKEFLKFLLPIIRKEFGGKGKAWNIDNVVRHYHKVEPSLIRVDADEVTYPAHVMLRYYLEKYLIAGDMEVADLPDAWAQGMEKFLNIKPDTDRDGCMQDIHWTDGSFGYFPSYSIGAIYASQLFNAAKASDDTILKNIEKGKLKPIQTWLNKNVHSLGCKLSTADLMTKATGKDIDVEGYKAYLKDRYL
ncbi:carboxypeptidase M32 [Rickettsiales bacterium]|nr:carboxypeptidase M32 [Rickettsiales bacterium]